ncbi:hypothetical protein ABZ863_05715 [Saccharomonospora sp. NPDC046836]|uniref:hypothetical protein n=1 Tax=Saccharomonospora sp. NPDC046836 TaxID=3156921 RepID=UPI0033F03161
MTAQWSFADRGELATGGLQHGDAEDPDAALVLVFTTRQSPGQLVKELQFGHVLEGRPLDRELAMRFRRRAPEPAPTSGVEIPVDGRPRGFRYWEADTGWQAAWRFDDRYALVLDTRYRSGRACLDLRA